MQGKLVCRRSAAQPLGAVLARERGGLRRYFDFDLRQVGRSCMHVYVFRYDGIGMSTMLLTTPDNRGHCKVWPLLTNPTESQNSVQTWYTVIHRECTKTLGLPQSVYRVQAVIKAYPLH